MRSFYGQFLPTVIDAFQILNLERGLVLDAATVRDAYREAGKRLHPDAGGGEGEFAALNKALAVLSSPSQRLSHWLELRGNPADGRGSIDARLMDLFSTVGEVTQQAETLIRKREEAKSALVRAMLESETQLSREAIGQTISQVEAAMDRECERFLDFENAESLDHEAASKCVRSLAFLEKWRAGLRGCYARLV